MPCSMLQVSSGRIWQLGARLAGPAGNMRPGPLGLSHILVLRFLAPGQRLRDLTVLHHGQLNKIDVVVQLHEKGSESSSLPDPFSISKLQLHKT